MKDFVARVFGGQATRASLVLLLTAYRSLLTKGGQAARAPSRLAILILLLSAGGFAVGQYRFDSWTVESGLPQNTVQSIAQTPDGYLWLSTLDGLVRFDGVRFTVFDRTSDAEIKSNRMTGVFVDQTGELWVMTEISGIGRRRDGRFEWFSETNGLNTNEIYSVQRNGDEGLLLTGKKGLSSFKDEKFTAEAERDFRDFRIYIGPTATRWEIGAAGLQVTREGRTESHPLPFRAADINSDRTFNYFTYVPMFESPDGALWMAAANSLFRFADGVFTRYGAESGMPAGTVRAIAADQDGSIWMATEKDGVCRLAGERVACYGVNEGLSSNNTASLFKDREGTLWIGTLNGGLNRVTPKAVETLSKPEGIADPNVYPILQSASGDIWIGSATSLARWNGQKAENFSREGGLPYEIVTSLFEDTDKRLWIGAIGGLQYFENGRFVDFTRELGLKPGVQNFSDIHRDRRGVLWLATSKGLVRRERDSTEIITPAEGLPEENVRVVFEANDGALWLGMPDSLAVLRDNGSRTITKLDQFPGTNIRCIFEDREGAFWIGTYDNGLYRYRDNAFVRLGTEAGLPSNGVFQIITDDDDNFWISTNRGIYRVGRGELNEVADGLRKIVNPTVFGRSDGMLSIECNGARTPAGIKTADGRMWFPTQNGVAIIDPRRVRRNPLAPPVLIESVNIEGVRTEIEGSPARKIEIRPGQKNLEVTYTGLSLIKSDQVRFRYRLEGLDNEWIEVGNRRTAVFPILPPGSYRFTVIAANSDSVWNETGASIEIEVLPAFYETRIFPFLVAAVLIALVYLVYRRRIAESERRRVSQEDFSRRLINAHESERQRVALELHDSIGQHLAMIKNSAVFGAQTIGSVDEAREQLAEISDQSAQAITEVREISYNLRPYMLDRLGLSKAIASMLRKIAERAQIAIETEIDDIDGMFDHESETSIFRIVQEGMNNILKHSGAKSARVAIVREGDRIDIAVSDNGRGFDVVRSGERRGFGLIGIEERVRMLGGTLRIESSPGNGTLISIGIWKKR